MGNEPRKATDIILSLEQQVSNLTAVVSSQDLLLKVISNKLSELLSNSNKPEAAKIIVEAVNLTPEPERQIPVSSEATITQETSPNGFRRTSRPETFAGDNAFLNKPAKKKKEDAVSFPIQIPKANGQAEVIVPDVAADLNKPTEVKTPKQNKSQPSTSGNVPVIQRIVDRNGKSVFLADVEIINLSNMESILKTRTNGTGKWQASLPIGEYKVTIKKLEALTKQRVEVAQNIVVDGTQSPLELQMMIIKS